MYRISSGASWHEEKARKRDQKGRGRGGEEPLSPSPHSSRSLITCLYLIWNTGIISHLHKIKIRENRWPATVYWARNIAEAFDLQQSVYWKLVYLVVKHYQPFRSIKITLKRFFNKPLKLLYSARFLLGRGMGLNGAGLSRSVA